MARFCLRPGRAALACLLLLGACGGARPADDPFKEYRVALADPEVHSFRDGLAVDRDALRAAAQRFGAEHRELIQSRLDASVAALRPGGPPSGPWYADVVTVEPAALAPVGELVILFEVFDPDVRSVVRRTLSLTLPAALAAKAGAPPDVAPFWLAFLGTAEPAWRNCGQDARHLTVCAEYGGVDVFVVELLRTADLWAPVAVTWWQRQP